MYNSIFRQEQLKVLASERSSIVRHQDFWNSETEMSDFFNGDERNRGRQHVHIHPLAMGVNDYEEHSSNERP